MRPAILAAVSLLVGCIPALAQHESHEQFGTVSFETSCKPETRTDFNRAVALLHSFEYRPATESFTKVLGAGSDVRRVDVDGHPGLWIDGAPHEVVIRGVDGETEVRRFAGNTLLWQDGDTIRRVEGFASLDEALRFVTGPRG